MGVVILVLAVALVVTWGALARLALRAAREEEEATQAEARERERLRARVAELEAQVERWRAEVPT